MTRILVLGDSFCPSSILREAFLALEAEHEIDYADVVEEPDWVPTTPSELRLLFWPVWRGCPKALPHGAP